MSLQTDLQQMSVSATALTWTRCGFAYGAGTQPGSLTLQLLQHGSDTQDDFLSDYVIFGEIISIKVGLLLYLLHFLEYFIFSLLFLQKGTSNKIMVTFFCFSLDLICDLKTKRIMF